MKRPGWTELRIGVCLTGSFYGGGLLWIATCFLANQNVTREVLFLSGAVLIGMTPVLGVTFYYARAGIVLGLLFLPSMGCVALARLDKAVRFDRAQDYCEETLVPRLEAYRRSNGAWPSDIRAVLVPEDRLPTVLQEQQGPWYETWEEGYRFDIWDPSAWTFSRRHLYLSEEARWLLLSS